MSDLCCMCGVEDTHDWFWRSSFGTVWCDNGCEDFATDTSIDLWPIALGLSIRRFLRRAEVDGLVADVRHETLRHDYHCNDRRTGCGCRGDLAQSALDRLAAMAMEGES